LIGAGQNGRRPHQEVKVAVTNSNSVEDKRAPLAGFELSDSDSGPPASGHPDAPPASLAGAADVFPVYPFI
jgi:hypothetical protein